MLFFLIALALALGVALLTGGSLRRIMETRLRAPWALFVAFALQLGLEVAGSSAVGGPGLGPWLLAASYALLLGFCMANIGLRGMSVVTIGIALNAAVITLNQGMPIRTTLGDVHATVKHHRERPSDRMMPLADIIVVPPVNQALSFGDLIMLVGLVDVLIHLSRPAGGRTRRRPETTYVVAT